MTIHKIRNIFTNEELRILEKGFNYNDIPRTPDGNYINSKQDKTGSGKGINSELGRLQFRSIDFLSKSILNKLNKIVKNITNSKLALSHSVPVEYSGQYGTPNLPVHWDHDDHDLIINFQLSSNTFWDLGIDKNIYKLQDNSALVFNANKYTHWRPHKKFLNEEYIKMIFFRFYDVESNSDYSHLNYTLNHEIFKEIEEFRNSLGT